MSFRGDTEVWKWHGGIIGEISNSKPTGWLATEKRIPSRSFFDFFSPWNCGKNYLQTFDVLRCAHDTNCCPDPLCVDESVIPVNAVKNRERSFSPKFIADDVRDHSPSNLSPFKNSSLLTCDNSLKGWLRDMTQGRFLLWSTKHVSRPEPLGSPGSFLIRLSISLPGSWSNTGA